MIASLAMYELAGMAPANDRLWALIRDGLRSHGIAAPAALTRGEDAYWPAWTAPDLVLSQTCGFPYRARLHDKVALIGTPDYGLPGCPPGHYCSVFVARRDDPRRTLAEFDGTALAYNEPMSQSGWAAPQTHASSLGLHFPAGLQTGGHRLSAAAVASGQADLAALDALTWALLCERGGDTVALREVARTAPTPGLPLIAAEGADVEATFAAVADANAALSPDDRETLHLKGIVRIAPAAYRAVPTPPPPAQNDDAT
ncbi:phosphate/phosphite/phosphonate ABC transporter substrate-binding protein [Fuscibacter oryzae]|uniref:PhnD/SsuA/transferrin family substrate-binding protein n=1 Tax=Fuscibacter oryzae TaxID=2803939 RepID=A0A8J7MNB4_9RHOB|nr:PhnD/SsuA/transferrin family substrate-binding protein [Fuscibacter oryzae]MBL4927387.1 PhnD/SsuA/transferrin family substrate-binding protein [Fuscibacter oryzae]